MGDAQTGLEAWGKRLVTAYRRHPGLEFVLLAGDLVDRGNERTNWDHFFLRARGDLRTHAGDAVRRKPRIPGHGPQALPVVLPLPRNGPEGIAPGLVYHFEVGSAFIAVLDSTLAVSDRPRAKRQAAWLDARCSRRLAPVEARHVPPPRLSVASLARHAGTAGALGAGLRQAPGGPGAPGPRSCLPAHLSDARPSPRFRARQERFTSSRSRGTSTATRPSRDYIEVGFTETSTYQTIEIDDVENRLTYRAWTDVARSPTGWSSPGPGPGSPPRVAGRDLSPTR